MLFMLFLCPIEVEGAYYCNHNLGSNPSWGWGNVGVFNDFVNNGKYTTCNTLDTCGYPGASIQYVTEKRYLTGVYNGSSWYGSNGYFKDSLYQATLNSANAIVNATSGTYVNFAQNAWLKQGFRAKAHYGYDSSGQIYAYHFKMPGYKIDDYDFTNVSRSRYKATNCTNVNCGEYPFEFGGSKSYKIIYYDKNGKEVRSNEEWARAEVFHMQLMNRYGSGNKWSFSPKDSDIYEPNLYLEKSLCKNGYTTKVTLGRTNKDVLTQTDRLFYVNDKGISSVAIFLQNYTLENVKYRNSSGKTISKGNDISNGYSLYINDFSLDISTNGGKKTTYIGQPMKSCDDGKNEKQRDYAYYLLWSTNVSCVSSTPPSSEPSSDDCEVESSKFSPSVGDDSSCSNEFSEKIEGSCKYSSGSNEEDISPYKNVLNENKNVRNDFCYLTTEDVDGKFDRINFSIYFGENVNDNNAYYYGSYLEPKLTIKREFKLKLHINPHSIYEKSLVQTCATEANKLVDQELSKKIKIDDWKLSSESLPESEATKFNVNPQQVKIRSKKSFEINFTETYEYVYKSKICYNSNRVTTILPSDGQSECGNNMCSGSKGQIYLTSGGSIKTTAAVSSTDIELSCNYEVIDSNPINIEYRPISLEYPFPGQNGENRKMGSNWDTQNIGEVITNSDRIDTDNPMYVIDLTSQDILNIRNNVSRDYTQDITEFGNSTEEDTCKLLSNSNPENISYKSGLITDYINEGKITGRCSDNNKREKLLCTDD